MTFGEGDFGCKIFGYNFSVIAHGIVPRDKIVGFFFFWCTPNGCPGCIYIYKRATYDICMDDAYVPKKRTNMNKIYSISILKILRKLC